ncbi:MAG: PEP-CTERM sorting domain-containing protein [Planctomycetota bacterium]|nr:MAG: PEP-CTERM sorting domain-containing protein [Planctomycetota bacterium]
MRKPIPILIALAIMGLSQRAQAVDLTLDSPTTTAGSTVAINVMWTGPVLNFLTTEFIITAVSGAPAGEVSFISPVATPPLSQSTYVFFGDSSDLINSPSINPASISTTNWANDTYNFSDSTDSTNNVTPGSGTNLWTILNLTITSLAAGQYQITLGSSEYTNSATTGTGPTPTITGGLITVNAAPVPEPSTLALAVIATAALASLARRRQRA